MKTNTKKAAVLLLVIIIFAGFSGCYLIMDTLGIPMSADIRIMSFGDALSSSSRTPIQIMTNFIPVTDMSDGSKALTETFWDSLFEKGSTFTFSEIVTTDLPSATAEMKETDSAGNNLGTTSVSFVMLENTGTGNFLIESFSLGSGGLSRSLGE